MNKLDELVPSYAHNKENLDALETICKEENKQIKELLGNESTYTTGGFKVTKSVSTRETVDEELLCAKLSEIESMYDLGIIRVKEYVHIPALEDAIYNKLLPQEAIDIIAKCRKTKEVVTLRVSKVKEEEE